MGVRVCVAFINSKVVSALDVYESCCQFNFDNFFLLIFKRTLTNTPV